ncbi:hypothetical protein PZ61_0236155 [Streptomyces sp. MNU77]|uniref:hypothetical protein n=1 Tax=Streptomyces sp. MNU77 TaxID=1573406 RepID=UPI0006985AEF|nr:hypothetical protein [Streptomyces sp. MNU77]OLO25858.1 hypothetical protein PZ61_0236155 [Streptomyces sp. MNU77]
MPGCRGPPRSRIGRGGSFILILHRRDDGLTGEELYCSLRDDNGDWDHPEHLDGSVLGMDVTRLHTVEETLAGAPLRVLGESASLILTGTAADADAGTEHDPEDDGHQLVHVWTLLPANGTDHIDIERTAPRFPSLPVRPEHIRRVVTGPVHFVALLPGESARITASPRTPEAAGAGHDSVLELRHPEL